MINKINEEICQFLDWDSDFFGIRIAKIKEETLTQEIFGETLKWCDFNNIDCLYFLADSSSPNTLATIENNRFSLVDIRMNLENLKLDLVKSISNSEVNVRQVSEPDIPALKQMAAVNHRDSRFYYDLHFPRQKCDELYATWIEKSCQGFADVVLIAEIQGDVVGYISCSIKNNIGNIGLVGVKGNAQGKGVGKLLVNQACQWFKSNNADRVTVVTQGRNVVAQRLYQKSGFITESIKLWYHLWLK